MTSEYGKYSFSLKASWTVFLKENNKVMPKILEYISVNSI